MANDFANYAIASLLTIVLEVAVAFLLGYRSRPQIAAVVCVNVFSHPLVNYLIWVAGSVRSAPIGPDGILLLECGVVLAEWLLLCYALRRDSKTRLLVLSLTMNSVSYLAGLLVFTAG